MTTRRYVLEHPILPAMTNQTPASVPCPCGSPTCPSAPTSTFFVQAPPAAQRGLAWTDGQIAATTIDASNIFTGTISAQKIALPLTVKQAAKALKKAGKALAEAQTAEREARMAATRASKALENARAAEKKARDELAAAALR